MSPVVLLSLVSVERVDTGTKLKHITNLPLFCCCPSVPLIIHKTANTTDVLVLLMVTHYTLSKNLLNILNSDTPNVKKIH